MAVTVESKGEPKKTTCGNCSAKLSYEFEDVREYTSTDYTGGKDTYYEINCPRCHKSTNVRAWRGQ